MQTVTSLKPSTDSRRIGYARDSSAGLTLASQIEALHHAGCSIIFSEEMTGSKAERPAWDRFLEFAQTGDTLIVTELSRMTRSILQLLETTLLLEERNIFIVSLRENIDTSTEKGRTFVSTMQALFQVDQQLRAERAATGRTSAKARGRVGGRPRTDPDKLENARILYETTDKTAAEVCALTGVGRRRFFSYIAEKRKERPEQSSRPKAGGTVFSSLLEAQRTDTP